MIMFTLNRVFTGLVLIVITFYGVVYLESHTKV
jgi:hypothetical protein